MNAFGKLFRVQIFGESHGESVGIVVDGCPAGLPLTADDMLPDLERRKGGKQKGTTPRQEADYPFIKSGVFNNTTTGFPIAIFFENNNTRSEDYNKQRSFPRPGHADWVAHQKFGGHEDYRGGGHFSARLTTGLVAAGAIAKKLMQYLTPNPSPGGRVTKAAGYITDKTGRYTLLKQLARQNRVSSTEAEEAVWQMVRNRNLDGYKFRRQHPVAGFIPDFVCIEARLIIEVDGAYHNTEDQMNYDKERTAWLQQNKYEIIRFTNEEAIKNKSAVEERIIAALHQSTGRIKNLGANPPSSLERETEGEVTISAAVTEIGGETDLEKGLQKAIDAKDSVGGIVECTVTGMPVGLGEPYFDSIESVLAHVLFTIPAVKGVEFGTGFGAAKMFGSQHNDAIENMSGKTTTNHAGGIVGGISNGNDLIFRIAIKPTSSTPKEQQSLNWDTQAVETFSIKGRHDLCVALRAPVIVEAVTAIVLADFMLQAQLIKRVV